MKIATWNIENIYYRHIDLVRKEWSWSLQMWMQEFERILKQETKSESQISRLRELSFLMGINKIASRPYALMQRRSGRLFVKSFKRERLTEVNSDFHWQGWIRVNNYPICQGAIQHKVKMIREEAPDILILQQVENRENLKDFVETYLKDKGYTGVYHFDTNTEKDLGFGLLLKDQIRLRSFQTHLDQKADFFKLFENDLQRYELETPSGPLLIYNTDFTSHYDKKSQIFRSRKSQAQRIANCLEKENPEVPVIFFGCLQTPRFCDSVQPITQLRGYSSILKHSGFRTERDGNYQSLGAYARGVNLRQSMYAIVNSKCFSRVEASGMNRKAIYNKDNRVFTYDSIREEKDQASNHPLLWMRIP